MRPVVFHGLFGHLHHRATTPHHGVGVVIVPALGRDERCAYGPMRLFADQLAAASIPTLRYDHRGEGDSLGLPRAEDNALPLWMTGIGHAIETLKAQTGVDRVVLAGLRIGGALAAQSTALATASDAAPADGLMLLAPVLSGRSWLRRLRFSAGIVGGSAGADSAPVDVDGICLSGDTAGSLSAVDLEALPAFGIPVFIAAQNRLVSDYAQRLAAQQTPVRSGDFPGFADLFLDTHSNQPPRALYDDAVRWLRETFPASPAPQAPRQTAGPAELHVSGAVERPVAFGENLRGVLCLPDQPRPGSPAVLFCNTGGDPRAGVGGFATQAARRLARNGLASLRFDFAGLGDSAAPQGVAVHVFQTSRQPDIAAAIALLAQQGFETVIMVGVCTGAYHILKATSHNPAIVGVFAVSPVKLMWEPGDSLVYDPGLLDKPTKAYAMAARDPRTWLRVFSGDVAVRTVTARIVSRLKKRLRAWSTRAQEMSPLSEMLKFTDRGGRACLLMGLNDASLDEVEVHFGSKGSALAGRTVSIQVHSDLDHGLARHGSRQIAMNTLLDWLDLPPSERNARR